MGQHGVPQLHQDRYAGGAQVTPERSQVQVGGLHVLAPKQPTPGAASQSCQPLLAPCWLSVALACGFINNSLEAML